jgi:hypothetical protein
MPRHEETTETQQAESPGGGHDESGGGMSYLRFGAMIATSMVFMYGVMYLNTFELAHVRWSETRLFMILSAASAAKLRSVPPPSSKDPAPEPALDLS